MLASLQSELKAIRKRLKGNMSKSERLKLIKEGDRLEGEIERLSVLEERGPLPPSVEPPSNEAPLAKGSRKKRTKVADEVAANPVAPEQPSKRKRGRPPKDANMSEKQVPVPKTFSFLSYQQKQTLDLHVTEWLAAGRLTHDTLRHLLSHTYALESWSNADGVLASHTEHLETLVKSWTQTGATRLSKQKSHILASLYVSHGSAELARLRPLSLDQRSNDNGWLQLRAYLAAKWLNTGLSIGPTDAQKGRVEKAWNIYVRAACNRDSWQAWKAHFEKTWRNLFPGLDFPNINYMTGLMEPGGYHFINTVPFGQLHEDHQEDKESSDLADNEVAAEED